MVSLGVDNSAISRWLCGDGKVTGVVDEGAEKMEDFGGFGRSSCEMEVGGGGWNKLLKRTDL